MSPSLALVLSVAVLGLGPLLAALLERKASLRAALDGFVLVMVGGLCLLFLLPHAYEVLGGWSFPIALLGLLVPAVSEHRLQHSAQRGASRTFMAVAMLGLLIHSAVDGAALVVGPEADHGHGHAHGGHETSLEIALAIVVHRLPVGLLVWSAVPPLLGKRWAVAALGALIGATGLGFFLSPQLHGLSTAWSASTVEALLAGGLLHVVLDHGFQGKRQPHGSHGSVAATLGALGALAVFVFLPLEPVPGLEAVLMATVDLFCESSPAILAGFLGAGLLSLVPAATMARLMTGRNAFTSALRGVIFGLPIPICSCGVVPIYRGLMQRGVPPAAAIAFLIATPELGVDAVALSIPLLGVKLTLIRLATALVVAMAAGLAVAAILRGPAEVHNVPGCDALSEAPPEGSALGRAMRYGFVDSLDDLGPWILAGLLVAGAIQPLVSPDALAGLPPLAEIPLFTALAAPFYVCAAAATPVAAVLLLKGVTAGAVVAFLLTGPATNVTTYGALRTFHGTRTTLLALATILVTSMGLGFLLNAMTVIEVAAVPTGEHAHGWFGQAAALLFCGLLLISLLRQGPRGFLRRLGISHDHDHGHDEHDHDSCDDDACHDPSEAHGLDHAQDDGGCCDHTPKPVPAVETPCCGPEEPCGEPSP
jgi:uncharacterized membrane protein YraQ (UPF0718 family)